MLVKLTWIEHKCFSFRSCCGARWQRPCPASRCPSPERVGSWQKQTPRYSGIPSSCRCLGQEDSGWQCHWKWNKMVLLQQENKKDPLSPIQQGSEKRTFNKRNHSNYLGVCNLDHLFFRCPVPFIGTRHWICPLFEWWCEYSIQFNSVLFQKFLSLTTFLMNNERYPSYAGWS